MAKKFKSDSEMLEIAHISKKYRKGSQVFTALDDVTFRIEKGDYVSVTGPSGSGKSTLLNTIGGLIHPDSGDILYYGDSIYARNGRYLNNYRKKKVGFIFQQFHLMPYLTVFENIRLACIDKSKYNTIINFLEKCSLSKQRDKYPSEISVGEKQRTAFIRAVISEPELLLADEPTGNLDPGNRIILMSLIEEYNKNGGTVVLVSHDPSAAGYSNLKVTLENGKLNF